MTELSALAPSPPGLGGRASPPPLSTAPHPVEPTDPPKPTPVPKSTLYGDPAVKGPSVSRAPPLAETPLPRWSPPPRPDPHPNVSVDLPLPRSPPPRVALATEEVTAEGPQPPREGTPPQSPNPEPPALPVPAVREPALSRAPDSLSYLESASLLSGTLESLSGLGDDGSSLGSDSELNGAVLRRTDKYGFLGGAQFSEGSEKESRVDVARQREMKWLEMFSSWDKWVSRRFQKVKLRCRKGIPSSLRARAWQLLSNSAELLESNPGKFEELEREPGDPKWLDIIEKDLHRQFPFHEMFAARGGHGQQDLFRILKAYTVYRPEEGYCQAQAPVAAVLLMHMPAEQAFWCLVQICETYLPGYYSAGLEAIQLDGEIFFALLRRVCPMAYRHLKKFKIDPILYMTEWFMCIFSRTLPWACVLRVWDMFFCEGVKVVFRVGLVLLKLTLGSVEKLKELQGMYETMERLRNIPPESVHEDVLITEVCSVRVSEALIERESSLQVRRWRDSRGPLSHQPGRRLHGSRSIHQLQRRSAALSSGGSFSFLGPAPPPGPLRASSSLLSLPGFRRSKAPFLAPAKKASLYGLEPAQSSTHSLASRPPSGPPAPRAQTQGPPAPGPAGAKAPLPPHTLSPKVVSEQITPTIPSPTANNAPMPPSLPGGKGPPTATATAAEEGKKKKKRSKDDKKKEKEEEKNRARERREKDRAEKERQRKEKGGKKKEKEREKGGVGGGGEPEEKNGATAPRDLA